MDDAEGRRASEPFVPPRGMAQAAALQLQGSDARGVRFSGWLFVFQRQVLIVMDDQQTEVLQIFRDTKALLQGHFVLRSGLHSEYFFQCAQVCQYMEHVERLASLLLKKLGGVEFTTVLAPAMGGLVIGQEVARQANARYLFAEKIDDKLALRRGFQIAEGEKVLVVEDVITQGVRAMEAINIVRQQKANPVALAVLVDRSEGSVSFGIPWVSLLQLSFPTYPPVNLPAHLASKPVQKPGS
jgi:orotate phosphoribosyltransferase